MGGFLILTRPIKFQADVLYPLDWLEKRLGGCMSVKTFLDNLGLDCAGRGRIFQNAVWGSEIIQARESTVQGIKTRETASMGFSADIATVATEPGKRKRGRPAKPKHVSLINRSDLS